MIAVGMIFAALLILLVVRQGSSQIFKKVGFYFFIQSSYFAGKVFYF